MVAKNEQTRAHVKLSALAARLGVDAGTLRRLASAGQFRCVRVGKQYLVPADEAERLVVVGTADVTAAK